MRILGIDPGYDRLGVAILDRTANTDTLQYSDCFLTEKRDTVPERLASLGARLEKLFRKWQPEIVALERIFFSVNKKTAIAVAETRGMITYLAAKRGLPIVEYAPSEVKVAVTGYGHADKSQVAAMVTRLVHLPHSPRYDDEYDAIAIALTATAASEITARSR